MMGFWDGSGISWAIICANGLHLAPDNYPHQHLVTQYFTGGMLFLTPSQQCQSTGTHNVVHEGGHSVL